MKLSRPWRSPLQLVFLLSLLLTGFKFVAYAYSGSLIVLASSYDSLADSILSYINSLFYTRARVEADQHHPFGHGGFEVLAGLIQGLVLTLFAVFLAVQSLKDLSLLRTAEPQSLDSYPWAIAAMVISALAAFGLQKFLETHEKRLKAQGSISLSISADRAHYASDAMNQALAIVGLVLVILTKSLWLDQILGFASAVLMMVSAWPLLKSSYHHIVQVEVEAEVQNQIVAIVKQVDPRVKDIHRLRTRRMGPRLFVDFHMSLPASMLLEDAHRIGDGAEAKILERFPHADVLVHLDPDSLASPVV